VVASALAVHVSAGGWAVVTVDTLPESAVVGAPIQLSFAVRQHGHMLTDGLKPRVYAVAGKDQISSAAAPSGKEGRYSATLTFPRPADWTVTIDSGFIGSRLTLLPLPVVSDASHAAAPMTAVGRGLRLFVAKGCVTCHQNGLSGNTSLGFAPALVAGKHQDGLLASILLKPEAVLARSPQPVGPMPNLGLQPDEVTALVAFINGGGTAVASR
jgi:mono/diheme cytochrome c family protein